MFWEWRLKGGAHLSKSPFGLHYLMRSLLEEGSSDLTGPSMKMPQNQVTKAGLIFYHLRFEWQERISPL